MHQISRHSLHWSDTEAQAVRWQEWATSQNIVLPHRENRANAAIVYKEEEEAPAQQTNILQASCSPPKRPLGNIPMPLGMCHRAKPLGSRPKPLGVSYC